MSPRRNLSQKETYAGLVQAAIVVVELHVNGIEVGLVQRSTDVRIGVRALGSGRDDVLLAGRRSERTDLAHERSVVCRSAALDVQVNTVASQSVKKCQ